MAKGGGGAVSALTKKEKCPPPAQNVPFTSVRSMHCNWLYAQLHYFLNFSQLLVSCLTLLVKLINSGVPDLSSHGNNNQTHLN